MRIVTGIVFSVFLVFFVGATSAWAPCGLEGYVFCDVNQNGEIDEGDTPLAGVGIIIIDAENPDTPTTIYTDENGFYDVLELDICAADLISLDESTLPEDVVFVDPDVNEVAYTSGLQQNWLVDSDTCRPPVAEPGIDIRKQAEGPDSRTFVYGADVTFEIAVTNTGDVDLTEVEVIDAMAPGCDHYIGDLAVGDVVTYECTVPGVMASFENEACVSGKAGDIWVDDCDPSTVVIEGGGQGCTPGYWKQDHHFDFWPEPYTPETLFADVFEDAFPGLTLLDVLAQGGGHLNALGRHTVAALLNSSSAGVSYDLTAASVIDMFNAVYPDGDYEGLKDFLEDYNQQGCPLNNDGNKDDDNGNGKAKGKDKAKDKGKAKGKDKDKGRD